MRIAIATVQVPFTRGGAEILTDSLRAELKKRGHIADVVSMPFKWYPEESLLSSMMMGRMIDLEESSGERIDKVIAMKFPAYYLKHDRKVLWLMHQHRSAYDLWGSQYGDIDSWENGIRVREFLRQCDKRYIMEYSKRYTIAQNTSDRLMKYSGIDSTVLYHPPMNSEKLHKGEFGDYVFYPSRINSIKRQRSLVEAAKYFKTEAKVIIAGNGEKGEIDYINGFIEENKLHDRVKLVGFISEEEKIEYYANCMAVYFGAYDEDYGYITLEGFFSEKPVIVHKDAGGPLEFVEDGKNGFVIDQNPIEIAKKIDYLFEHKDEAEKLGKYGRESLKKKNMSWDYVIEHLLED